MSNKTDAVQHDVPYLNIRRAIYTLRWKNSVKPKMVNYPMMPSVYLENDDFPQNTKLSL